MNGLFVAAFSLSFFLKTNVPVGFFNIVYDPINPVDVLVYQYPKNVFPILAIITLGATLLQLSAGTRWFSRERVLSDAIPSTSKIDPRAYSMGPTRFALMILFLVITGLYAWTIHNMLRSYDLYNYAHDFRSQTQDNFVIYAFIYLVLYQAFYPQALVIGLSLLGRSVLKKFVYRK